jgi:hypothetical protein
MLDSSQGILMEGRSFGVVGIPRLVRQPGKGHPVMKLQILTLLALSVASTTQAASSQMGPPPGSFEMLGENETAVVPFDINHRLIRLTGRMGGREVRLHLDTGFPYDGIVLFGGPEVDAMDLPYSGKIQVGGAGGPEPILADHALGQTIDLPGLRLTEQAVTVLPYDSLRGRAFSDVDGTIGGSLFNHLVVAIDFEQREIRLTDPATFEYSGPGEGLSVGVRPDLQRTVQVDVEAVDGTRSTLDVCLDLGASHVLSINLGAVEGMTVPGNAVETSLGVGLAGEERGHVGRVRRLTLGDFVLEDVVTSFSASPWLQEIEGQGNLGSQALQRFHVVFDFARDRMYLEPNSRFRDPFEFSMSGLGLMRAEGGLVEVVSVIDDSPGNEAGLQVGDVITALDGVPLPEIGGEELNAILKEEGRVVNLTITRSGEEMAVHLHLRRIV